MKTTFAVLTVGLALWLAGCSSQTPTEQSAAPAADTEKKTDAAAPGVPVPKKPTVAVRKDPAPPPPLRIPAGAEIVVRTMGPLSTKTATTGESFTASLEESITDGGRLVAAKGAMVGGTVVESDDGGKVKGRASITVRLTSVTLANGKTLDVDTNAITRQANASKKKDAAKIGAGAGIGAAIGAIAGGGKGAAIGAAIGGGAGTGAVLATKGDPAVIPAETVLRFQAR